MLMVKEGYLEGTTGYRQSVLELTLDGKGFSGKNGKIITVGSFSVHDL